MNIRAQVGERVVEVVVDREDARYVVRIDDERHVVDAQELDGDFLSILLDGKSYEVSVAQAGDGYEVRHGGFERVVRFADPSRGARDSFGPAEGPQDIVAVMPGKVVRVLVEEGQDVEAGQGLVVVEAMKMENEIESPKDGRVTSVAVQAGEAVESGATLLTVD